MPVKQRRARPTPLLPVMMAELAVASAQTIAHRSTMAATGQCSSAEYSKMVVEKLAAMQQMTLAMMVPGVTAMALLSPWHRAATRNSKRLGRK